MLSSSSARDRNLVPRSKFQELAHNYMNCKQNGGFLKLLGVEVGEESRGNSEIPFPFVSLSKLLVCCLDLVVANS